MQTIEQMCANIIIISVVIEDEIKLTKFFDKKKFGKNVR